MSSQDPDRSVAERLQRQIHVSKRLRRQLKATAAFAECALRTDAALADVLQAACQAACDGSGVGYSKAMIPDAEHDELIIRAGAGWHADVIGMRVPVNARSVSGATLLSGKPLIIADLRSDRRFDLHEPLASHGIVSTANVPIALNGVVLGVLELDSAEPLNLNGDDLDFLQTLVAPIAAAILRVNFEQVALRAEQRLRENEQRLRTALGAGKMGTWLRRLSTGQHLLDASLRQMMGLAPGQSAETFEDFLAAVHPDDRAGVHAAFDQALHERGELSVDFRALHPGHGIRWLHDQGRVFTDGAGRPDFMAGVCTDITERKQAEMRLRQADRSKTEFLATLAHELRSPMAPLRNAVALLARGTDDASRTRSVLDMMQRQLGHLTHLVGDLLEMSRIEQGKIELRIEPVALGVVLAAAVETVQPMVESHRQRLAVRLPSATTRIAADAVRLTQVVANLLTNASKFTPAGGAIELAVEEHAQDVAIVVRDEGVGIAPEVLPHIFGLFEQGGIQALDRAESGLGIGLALVKRLAELHGGTVAAESEGAGKGATFTVRLPRGAASPDR